MVDMLHVYTKITLKFFKQEILINTLYYL